MSIVFIQHGNYANAYERFQSGLPETYRDQRKSVGFVENLSQSNQITVISLDNTAHDKKLTPTLRSIGVERRKFNQHSVKELLDHTAPSHIICRTPHIETLAYAKNNDIVTLPCFADIFIRNRVRGRIYNARLSRVLHGRHISCVANHSLNASRSLHDTLKIREDMIVPWDWSKLGLRSRSRDDRDIEPGLSIFFAGSLSVEKGVLDCIKAASILKLRGLRFSFTFAGPGDLEKWRTIAREHQLSDEVRFLGSVPNTSVIDHMTRHDCVIVPSRHEYPEGLPNTIYEGLSAQAALILSDHPAFSRRLTTDQECVIFEAGNPKSLANVVARLLQDSSLLKCLSSNAGAALDKLYFGMEWEDLIANFISDPESKSGWVSRNSIAALQASA